MAATKARRKIATTAQGASSDVAADLEATLRGEMYTQDWVQRAIMAGKMATGSVGAFSTPIQGGGAGTVFDQDQPEVMISVPTGKTIYPVYVRVECKQPLAATDSDICEILIARDNTQASNASASTGTVVTLTNARNDIAAPSGITVVGANTVNVTLPVLSQEIDRGTITADMNGTPANAMWTRFEVKHEPKHLQPIVGPACLIVYWGGTVATSGYCQFGFIVEDTPPVS